MGKKKEAAEPGDELFRAVGSKSEGIITVGIELGNKDLSIHLNNWFDRHSQIELKGTKIGGEKLRSYRKEMEDETQIIFEETGFTPEQFNEKMQRLQKTYAGKKEAHIKVTLFDI